MSYQLTKNPKSTVTAVITVAPADYAKHMEAAATRLSQRAAIHGFRPGKAPYNIVKQQLGEVRILEEAMQSIVEKNFFQVVQTEKLETIGMPQITIEKFAPGNDLVFKAEVALLPEVKLADIAKIKVEKKAVTVSKEQLDETINHLRKMQGKEVLKDGAAGKDDKIVVDFDMFIDNVAIEGGQAKNHQIYLNEPHYIPGLAEQLVGLKKDDAKEFKLKFPKEHYQKNFAGKDVDIKVKANEVYTLEYPEINEEFAKKLGQKSLEELRNLLTANISKEEEKKETERVEVAILDQVIEGSTFGEIPEVLLNAEKQKIFYELKQGLEERGISVEQYLNDIKKTEQELQQGFAEQAEKRAKAALISRAIAKENNLAVEQSELNAELDAIRAAYPNNPTVEENLKRQEVLDTIASTVQNRKVMKFLKEKIVK
jgi:trigger factor